MGNRLDDVTQKIAELTNAIKEKNAKGQGNDLDMDAIEAKFAALIDAKFKKLGTGRKGEFDVGDDIEQLPGTGRKMQAAELVESVKDIDEMSDLLYLGSKMLGQPVQSMKLFGAAKQRFKAMDTTEGTNWVPTEFSSSLIRLVEVKRMVAGLFGRVNMPSNPYVWPLEGSDLTAYLAAESTSDTATKFTASDFGTDKRTFTAAKFAVRTLLSKESDEDMIIPVLPHAREKVAKAIYEAEEEAVLSGDTTATHQDSDIHALGAGDRRKAWKGLRKIALALGTATTDLSTFEDANMRAVRSSMGKYGINPADLAWIVGLKTYLNHMLGLTNVRTVDKYGPSATILSGELGKYDGIPIVVSAFSRETLNAAGVHDGSTTDNGELELVHRPSFLFGDRRSITIQIGRELYMETGQDVIVATVRETFKPMQDETAEPIVALGYNIDCA